MDRIMRNKWNKSQHRRKAWSIPDVSRMVNPPDAQIANALPTASRRYGRLPICATWPCRPESRWAQDIPLVLGLLDVLQLTEPRSGPPRNSQLLARTRFLQNEPNFCQKLSGCNWLQTRMLQRSYVAKVSVFFTQNEPNF
jgi:hypothetical protein